MVVRRDRAGSGSTCIPQSQHAAVAGQIARAWGNLDFPIPSPHRAVCLAADRHDDGMEDFDRDPELDPGTGMPRDFMKMPLETWLDCWRQGPSKVGEEDPYAGVLVSMHGLHLLGYREIDPRDRRTRELVDAYRNEQEDLQRELLAAAGELRSCEEFLGGEDLETNRKLIAAWDAMSLAVCVPRLPVTVAEVPLERGETELRMSSFGALSGDDQVVQVEPWPFAPASVPLTAAGRRLDGPAGDQEALDRALAEAPLRTFDFTLVRPGDSSGEERDRRRRMST